MIYTEIHKWKVFSDLTSLEMANKLGVSRGYLQELMAGKKIPGKELALKIHHLTNIPIKNLLYPNEQAAAPCESGNQESLGTLGGK